MSYALRFHRENVPKPWAGDGLRQMYPDAAAEWPTGTGESLEVGDMPGARTLIANGAWKDRTLSEALVDNRLSILGQLAGSEDLADFPLCLKLVDTQAPLSVQVHPSDVFRKGRRVQRGKSEGWLVLRAAPESVIYQGLKPGLTRADFEDALRNQRTPEALNARPVKAGDWLANPAGLVHAIGPGLVLLELQQNCDQTFRLWDFPRPSGPFRGLHLPQGLAAARFDLKPPPIVRAGVDTLLHDSGPFGARHLVLDAPRELARTWAGFTLVTCIEGELEVSGRAGNHLEPAVLKAPDTVMFTADFWDFEFFPRGRCRVVLSWARAS